MAEATGAANDLLGAFSDADRLRRLRALVEACRRDPEPHLSLLPGSGVFEARRLAVLPGSFNPLTEAHVALADAADSAGFGPIAFTLSTRTVNKERLEGALLEDRLLVLEAHASRREGRLVALINRGLYVEQAELFRSRLEPDAALTFLVGFDKIVQIFDPRYYEDRDAALERLFALASFAVAPRAGAGRHELAELLGRPENRRYAKRVQELALEAGLADVAASEVRALLDAGQPLPSSLPAETIAFVTSTGCYADQRRYEQARARLLDG